MPAILEKWQVQRHGQLIEIDDGILTVTGEIKMLLGIFPRQMTVFASLAIGPRSGARWRWKRQGWRR